MQDLLDGFGYLTCLSIGVLRLFHLKSSLIDVNSDMLNMMFILIIFSVFMVFFHVLNSGMKTTVVDRSNNSIWNTLHSSIFIIFANASCFR